MFSVVANVSPGQACPPQGIELHIQIQALLRTCVCVCTRAHKHVYVGDRPVMTFPARVV